MVNKLTKIQKDNAKIAEIMKARKAAKAIAKAAKRAAAALVILFLTGSTAFAETDTEIVTAIYKAEGGEKATYLYGIRSVNYDTPEEARRICFNTVRNNRVRFANQDKYNDYLEFLASRYCPIDCDNDTGTNKYWLKNVRYFLDKNKEVN